MTLVSEPQILRGDPLLEAIAAINGNEPKAREIQPGVYEIGHFGSSHWPQGYNQYPETTVGTYGVCDSAEQLLAKCPELEASDRHFIVTLTLIDKANQPSEGGWRWHKWGNTSATKTRSASTSTTSPTTRRSTCSTSTRRRPLDVAHEGH